MRAARVASLLLLAAAVGLCVYLATCLILPPGPEPISFGLDWQRMSAQPFALSGQLPHRLLAPLLAWLCGLGGAHYVDFARGLSVLLLAVVFLFCRSRGSRMPDALLVTVAVGISGAVQMYKQCWVGYVDDLAYALFLLAAMAVRRPLPFWALLFANLCNHELAAFLLPWAWWLRREAGAPVGEDLIGASLALAAYAGFYLYVQSHAAGQVYNARFFAEHHLFPLGSLWLWILMLVQWLAAYGPLLSVLAWHQHVRAHGKERLELWLVLGGVMAIFAVAFDVTRHTNLLVLPLVVASQRFLAAGRRREFLLLLAASGLCFWLWPAWQAGSWPMRYFLAAMGQCGVYTDFHKVLSCLLPQTWPAVLLVVVLLALLGGLGGWLARATAPEETTGDKGAAKGRRPC